MLTDCGDARVPIYVSFSMPWLGAMYLTNGYDIPNIEGFELLPYVEYLAPKLNGELLTHQARINKEKLEKLV